MLKSILKYFNEGNIFYALEVCEIDNEKAFHLLEIRRKKNEIFITDSHLFYNLQEITSLTKKGVPLLLTLNSNSVLTKTGDSIQSNDIETLVNIAYPNLDFNLFYYEVICQPNNSIISVVKKETIDTFLRTLESLKISVVGITLSTSKLPAVCSYLDDSIYSFSRNKIEIKNNQISTIVTPVEKNIAIIDYEINSLKVNSKQVLNLSSIISFINKSKTSKNNFEDKLVFLNSEYKNKRHFKILFNFSVISILTILLLNFFFFNYYYSKVEELKTNLQVSSTNKQKLVKIKEQVYTKEERINTIKSGENSKITYYLDNIALYTPNTITLKSITYQPFKKAIRDEKKIELIKNIFFITGTTNSSNDYSIWLEKLERQSFINSIENIDYQYNNIKSSNFTIKILTNE